LPDGLFLNQTPSFGTFWEDIEWKILISFITIWYSVWQFDLFYGKFGIFYGHLLHYSHFGIMYRKKSGNPATEQGSRETR
jgi:hypothetical protein